MDLTQMTRGALRQELDKRGLDTDGPRPTLIDRLTQALSQEELECNDAHYKTELGSISGRSVSSVRSKASSLASCRALTSAKLAGLKARAASLKKKHELDKQAVELQARREDLDLEMELGEALARQATFTKIGFSDGVGITGELINATEPQVDDNTGTARKTCRATVDELSVRAGSSNHLGSNQGDIRKIDPTHDHVTRLHLPTLEFSTFKGNNEHYPSFMRAFQTNIASRLSNEEEKLHYLLQYTADKPRDIVSTCLYLPPEQGYKEAKRLLDRRYGNFAQMAVSLVGTILEYPIIKSEDVEGLDSFAIHLRGSLNALKSLPHGAGSVDVKTIRALVDKVPYHMKEKWRRVVDGIEQTSFRQATFEDFVDFVEVEARIATNPSYGRIMLGAGSAKGKSRERRSEHVQVAGVSSGKLFAGNLKDPTRVSNTCLCCSQEHETHECPELLAKTPEDKNRFIFENHLCFGCLTANHVFRFCKNKKKCQVCGGSHATVLHRDQQRPRSPTVTSGHVAPIYQGGAKLQAVAVRITVCGNSLTTYAFLDSGSTHSFICAPLLRALGISPITNTSITLSTISKDEKIDSCVIPHLWIESLDGAFRMELPPLFVLDKIPISRRDTPGEDDLKRWSYLKESGVTLEDRVDGEVGLLIGSNAAAVMEPLQVVPGQGGGPYAIRTRFGWFLGGVPKFSKVFKINQTKLTIDDDTFGNRADTRKGYSVEDREWHFKVESSCHLKKGQYELELPFRHREPRLPNNRNVAERRLGLLKRKMQKQPEFAVAYNKQIEELVVKGYVERATGQVQNTDHIWYLPHHGVRHPAKPHKLRIVFDCASRFKGISLNDELLQGPDLTNTMVDVLLRFRQDKVAFMADIESMFLRVRVPQHQRDYLRFLWWTDGDPEAPIQEYRATSHLFGAVSSPSCANYALRRTARDFGNCYDSKVALTIDRNFYVDDALVSVATDEDAISLALSVRELCSRGGFKLTKFSSNSVAVLQAIPKEDRAAQVRDLNLGSDYLPADRALGVYWDVQTDSLGFDVDVDSFHRRPVTRRGILSATAAFYDPFGIASPFVIRARILLQELTRLKLGWDERVPIKYSKVWAKWLQDLRLLAKYRVPRTVCVGGMSAAARLELHHFSDASEKGYGVATYVRSISEGRISCGLLLSRAHLAPIKTISIPRLELTAATLAVKVNMEAQRALDFQIDCTFFWTDSSTVLKYIKNRKTRFHVFVANRLAAIHDGSSSDQWFWVPSQLNPADLISRGMNATKFIESALWKYGPEFLLQQPDTWPQAPRSDCTNLSPEDPEVKIAVTTVISGSKETPDPTGRLITHFSSWTRLIRAVAWIRRVLSQLRNKSRDLGTPELSVTEIEAAKTHIIRHVQGHCFQAEIKDLNAGRPVRVKSPIASLDPTFENGLLRVGGRLTNAGFDCGKHPLILPNKGSVVDMIIDDAHEKAGHEGRQHVMNDIRTQYWILKTNSAVRRRLRLCISCRKRLRPVENQKMANLPADRVKPGEKPWTSTGVDFFGPFYTKRGRAMTKKYGVIFTCLAIRAVHLEVADSLSTDSFLCALRRFIARRGEVRTMRSDNGLNFVGANRELKREIDHLIENEKQVTRQALARSIEWRFNPPGASHFGGAWERLIRSVRKILNALLTSQTFSDETLRTLLCEVECIINNRPLTPVSADHRDRDPLTPNHLLHLESISLPISRTDQDLDLSSKRNWRQASYLAEQFWRRWRLEYIPLLQTRAGPTTRSRENVKTGDVVLVVDDSVPRGVWPLGLVEAVRTSDDLRVRSAKVRCRGSILWRPVKKLVKITETSD